MDPLFRKSLLFCCALSLFIFGSPAVQQSQGQEQVSPNAIFFSSTGDVQPSGLLYAKQTNDKSDDSELYGDEEKEERPQLRVADPFEPLNRAMFVFNDKCYFWVLKPVATGYKAITPEFFRIGLSNFFHNVGMPIRFMNCILQGKPKAAGGEFARFMLNTTVGLLGFMNPSASHPELNPDEEDFGQTLGRYGIGHGIYIVWPFLGPSSIRDTVGFGGDYFLKPVTYVDPTLVQAGISTVEKINDVSFKIGDYETFKAAAIEPYSSARDAYLQYRKGKVEK